MKKLIIIGGIILLVGGGLYYYYRRQIDLLSNFTYKFLGVHMGGISGTDTNFTISLRIYSGSTIEAQITNLQVDVYIAGAKVGHITNTTPIIIPAKGYSDMTLNVVVNPNQLLGDAAQIIGQLISYKDASLMINGFADVKSSFLTLSIPVSYQDTIKSFI